MNVQVLKSKRSIPPPVIAKVLEIHQGNWIVTTAKINNMFAEGGRNYSKDELKCAFDKERKAISKLKDNHDPRKAWNEKRINAKKIYEKEIGVNEGKYSQGST